jgi:hypothetical protein
MRLTTSMKGPHVVEDDTAYELEEMVLQFSSDVNVCRIGVCWNQ